MKLIENGNEPPTFGAKLKAFRIRAHLTQQQLAESIGVHRHAIGRWEQGDVLPASKTMVLELARRLRLDEQETRRFLEASLTGLSPHWMVPLLRNPFFTGREEILKALHTNLAVDQMVALTQSYALHGLGGIGKTQIALEYAYRHALEYSAVFWIRAETNENIVASLLRIAEALQLPGRDEKDQQHVVAAVQRWLTTHSQWLLIWDNLEDLGLLPGFLPTTRAGASLITTRHQALGTLAHGIDLLPMEQEEGILFLLRRAKVLEPGSGSRQMDQLLAVQQSPHYAAAADLVRAMGGLPLALDQAGGYIEETGCSLSGYLRRYERQRAILLDRRGGPASTHPQSVTATFSLSMEQVERERRAAADMLRVCALLHAEAIPEELFITGATYLGPALETLADDPSRLDQLIATLRSLSLVQRHPGTGTLSLHRLVQMVLRDGMSEQERSAWLHRTIHALDALFPVATDQNTADIWKQCERLLSHVLTLVPTLADEAGDRELVSVLGKAADYLRQRVQLEQAELLYEQALHLGEQALGAEHPALADPLTGLATLYRDQGKYEQAEPLYERALRLREEALGPEHLLVSYPLVGLATLYEKQGKTEQAESLFQRSLHICEQALGLEHPQVAHSLNGLAILYRRQGKYEQAESLYERALHIREQALGPEHPQMMRLLYNLACLYQEQGKYKQAASLYERSLRIEEQTWEQEHPNMSYPLVGLGIVALEQGKYEQAERLLRRSLSLCEQSWGAEHQLVAYPLHNLAILSKERGEYEQAEALSKRALHIAERAWGPGHAQVAHPLNGLADIYAEQGNDEQAESLYQRALQIREQELGAEHPDLAASLNGLANLCRKQGKYGQAEPLYERALLIRERRLEQQHPDLAQTLYDLALLRESQGNLNEASSLAERALAIRLRSLGEVHPKTIETQVLCAQLLQEQSGGKEQMPTELAARHQARPHKDKSQMPLSDENDSLQGFLDGCCELHPLAWCRIGELRQAYEHWTATEQRCIPLPRKTFAAHLKARGCRVDRTSAARIWRGIRLVKTSS